MFGMKTIKEQALDLRCENAKLKTVLDKTNADIDYIAMMCDVELDTDGEQEDTDYEQ